MYYPFGHYPTVISVTSMRAANATPQLNVADVA